MPGNWLNPKPPNNGGSTGNVFHDMGDRFKDKAKNLGKIKVKARSLISNRVKGISNGTYLPTRVSGIESYGLEQTKGDYASEGNQGSGMMIWILIGGVILFLLNPFKRRNRR